MVNITLNKGIKAVDCPMVGNRWVEVDISGYKAVIEVSRKVSDEQIQKALDYAYSTLCQSCYMELILADNFLILSQEVFKKKKVFKFNLKKHFLDCQTNIRDTMKVYERHMDEDYYNEYSTTMWEFVEGKVEQLRKLIEDKLRNLRCKYSPYLCSYAIMIQNLTQQVSDTYKHVMDIVKRDYDGIDLTVAFSKHNAKMAYTQADNLLYDVMHGESEKFTDNIVKNKKIIEIWSDITKTLYNPHNARKARMAAFYNMPDEQQALYNLREEDGFCELKEGVEKWKKGA